jgi:hypothetical protein
MFYLGGVVVVLIKHVIRNRWTRFGIEVFCVTETNKIPKQCAAILNPEKSEVSPSVGSLYIKTNILITAI